MLSLALITAVGPRRLFVWGTALTVAALALSALTRDLWTLGLWRVLAGIGGAPVFVAGGAVASAPIAVDGRRGALAIALIAAATEVGAVLPVLARRMRGSSPRRRCSAHRSSWCPHR